MADTSDDVVYKANLNIEDILSGLTKVDRATQATAQRIDAHFKKAGKSISGLFVDTNGRIREANGRFSSMGNAAAHGFGQAEGGAKNLGLQIGLISGITSSLVTAFINLGQRAVGVLIEIGQHSIQTALEMDTLKARLRGIFDGSQEAADQAFGFIQEKSKELGFDLSELAGAFIPKTESLAQFERVAKIATALARSDPEQGAIGARIALIEALSGTFTSLQRRFEIGKQDTKRIQEAFNKEGIEGFLTTLETVLQEGGRSFDDFADTAATSFAKVQISSEQILGRVGVPIVASLEEAANKILEFLGNNEDDLIVFADTIGRAIADVIDFIASVDLSQLDTQSLIEFADYIFRIVNAVELVVSQFTGWVGAVYQTADAVGPLGESLDALYYLITNLDDALVTLSQILAVSKAGYEGLYAGIQPLLPLLENLFAALGKASTGDFLGAAVAIGDSIEALKTATFDSAAAQDAINASLTESAQAFADYQSDVDGNTDSQKKLREELKETKNAGTAAADAIQAAGAAERQAAQDAAALEEAQTKVNKALADAEEDFSENLQDIDIATARKRFDILKDFADKRVDAARKNLGKIADIEKKNDQAIEDAREEKDRAFNDADTDLFRNQLKLAKEEAQKEIDVEEDFRRKLADIRNQFEIDAEEAERNRDAVGFLKAMGQRDREISEAQKDRQRTIEDTKIEGQRKREELQQQYQFELIDATKAYDRKREDLRTSLARQLDDQREAFAREREEININESRKLEELAISRERDIEDAKLGYARKLADLQEALAAELALIEEFAAKKAAAEAAASSGTSKSKSPKSSFKKPSTTGGSSAGFGSNPGTITGHAYGGLVNRGQAVPVGERGPELFTPNANGRIVPNNALVMPSMTPKSVINNISNSRTNAPAVNFPVGDASLFNDPIFVAKLRNVILSTIDEVG